jgi:hypothetical protein
MFLRNFGMHLQVHIEFKSRRTKPESWLPWEPQTSQATNARHATNSVGSLDSSHVTGNVSLIWWVSVSVAQRLLTHQHLWLFWTYYSRMPCTGLILN